MSVWEFGKEYNTKEVGKQLWFDLQSISSGSDPYEYGLNSNWLCRIVRIGQRDYMFSNYNDKYVNNFNKIEYSEIIKIYGNLYNQAVNSIPKENSTVNKYNSSKTPRLLVHLLCKEINNTNLLKAQEYFPTVTGKSGKTYTISIDDNNKIFVENLEYTDYTVELSLSDLLKDYILKNDIFNIKNGVLEKIDNVKKNKLYNYKSQNYNNIYLLITEANNRLTYISNLYNRSEIPIINSIPNAKISNLVRPNISVDEDKFKNDLEEFSSKKK